MDYIVTLTAYIDQQKRPENFPHAIKDIVVGSWPTVEELAKFVNTRLIFYAQTHGVSGALDSAAMEDLSILDTNRVWVPMHMVTHVTASYRSLAVEMPQITATGAGAPSGKDIVKH